MDELGGAQEPAHSPAGGVEVLAGRADGDGETLDFGGESGDPGERDVEEAVVDFVGEDDYLVLDAEVTDLLELLSREDLADGVVCLTLAD